MESSVHREVQALFGGGTVETCHGDMVRRHFPTLQKGGKIWIRYGYQCDSFLNKAFVVEGQNQALTKERKFQMLGELTIREVE